MSAEPSNDRVPELTAAESLAQLAGDRRAAGAAFVEGLTAAAGAAPQPVLAFDWEDIEGIGYVRVPVDPDARSGAVAAYQARAHLDATTTAAIEAELGAYQAKDDVARARDYTPDVRAALARRAATRSPI